MVSVYPRREEALVTQPPCNIVHLKKVRYLDPLSKCLRLALHWMIVIEQVRLVRGKNLSLFHVV
jgi:hypothetical protein